VFLSRESGSYPDSLPTNQALAFARITNWREILLNRLFPERVDNRYLGHSLGLWLFAPIALMKLGFGTVHIVRPDGGAQSVSTIPLDAYPADAAQNIVALMSRMGVEQLLIAAIFLIVLLRYRAMIPLMYALSVSYYLLLQGVALMKPLALTGTSGANTPVLALTIISCVGLVFSLMGKGYKYRSSRHFD
jgi:hypothetical protein